MAARSIASAYVSFGLVSIPVRLYSASQSSETISFRMLHGKCKSPVKQQYICPNEGQTVDREDIVKGYEYTKDQYVVFTPEELKAVEEEATKTIAIQEFVPQEKVDTIYFDKAYYLGPDKGGERAYCLLGEAMRKAKLVGLASYAARGKQYLVLIRPGERGIVMQQLRYSEEVRPVSEVPLPDDVELKDAELKLALQLIQQSVSKSFEPGNYKDAVRTRLQEIIQQKVEGQEISFAPGETPKAQVIDLMQALKASLGQAPEETPSKTLATSSSRKPAKASPRKAASKSGSTRKRASK